MSLPVTAGIVARHVIRRSCGLDASLIPPVEMLFDGSSSVEQFIAFGEGFVRNILIPRAGLLPSDVFLDLGCGNGRWPAR